jgi:hypothetical protein
MSLVNLFSNVWFYFLSSPEDNIYLEKLKQAHNITQQLDIDQLTKFWQHDNSGYGSLTLYNNNNNNTNTPIDSALIAEQESKLVAFWKTLAKRIYDHVLQSGTPWIILSPTPRTHECLIGLYLFILKTYAQMPLEKSTKALASKIAGLNYVMSDSMKKVIYRVCY